MRVTVGQKSGQQLPKLWAIVMG